MKEVFSPNSVVLIGASRFKGKVGNSIAKNLLKFKKAYFVNPKAKKILGRKSYSSVIGIPGSIDMAVIAVKPDIMPSIIEECGKKGIKLAVIITSGYSEIGNYDAEKKLLEIARKYNIRILGPNCFGIINPYLNLNCTFSSIKENKGRTAFISQSGALASSVLDFALSQKIGFSFFATIGNQLDMDFADVMEYLNEDRNTKLIILYLESLKDGRKFLASAKKCKKPIFVIKAGKTREAQKAALTHTGSMAGDYDIYKGAFRQSRIIELGTLQNMLDVANFLQFNKHPKTLLILTNAGGPGVLAVDYSILNRIELAKIPEKTTHKLNQILPSFWSHKNPIDIGGEADPKRFKKVLEILENESFYDAILCIITPQQMTNPPEMAAHLVNFKRKTKKSLIAAFIGAKEMEKASLLLNKNKILCFQELKRCTDVLGASA
jgi:acetyltransferase